MSILPAVQCGEGATLSQCGTYRYALWRDLMGGEGVVTFVMLNPSTADASSDDPTIRRCLGFARTWGRRHVRVANLFALRSTDPRALSKHHDPIGPENKRAIVEACDGALVVCAWGTWGSYLARGRNVREQLTAQGIALHHLGLTASGEPKHPLYLRGNTQPTAWSAQ